MCSAYGKRRAVHKCSVFGMSCAIHMCSKFGMRCAVHMCSVSGMRCTMIYTCAACPARGVCRTHVQCVSLNPMYTCALRLLAARQQHCRSQQKQQIPKPACKNSRCTCMPPSSQTPHAHLTQCKHVHKHDPPRTHAKVGGGGKKSGHNTATVTPSNKSKWPWL